MAGVVVIWRLFSGRRRQHIGHNKMGYLPTAYLVGFQQKLHSLELTLDIEALIVEVWENRLGNR